MKEREKRDRLKEKKEKSTSAKVDYQLSSKEIEQDGLVCQFDIVGRHNFRLNGKLQCCEGCWCLVH